ncbi:hypothetical protein, variant [Blastomyces gilchristii SLH14081]|uniref:Uncharacterized protein n=1 Tax=Blastomyces gilchristii (strain SLH14081) TaxID=559298 RepID=A0A179U7L7_BLAGS|nr:uncharacterized protein BDBG_00035 [Blastomyces gilchristii SLH14081]XP_031575569.1 hypothetical protein, variant [Blastomyces gilchristii SLH14081]OAT03299.1 hypothetical protein BDBG_00035 [Blastomyces gilchristii SLH14081]OAT03300.1 hypothetical protein, variant [Blastomyces gilchristii SLH14081]
MDTQNDPPRPEGSPRTPPHPPYSPITPVLSHAAMLPPPSPMQQALPPPYTSAASTFCLATSSGNNNTHNTSTAPPPASNPAPTFMAEPAPVPISESDNPDAIALRSAISILQIQKQQAVRDIKTLDHLKQAAVAHPEAFARELAKGTLTSKSGDIFNPTGIEDGDEDGHADGIMAQANTSTPSVTDVGAMDVDEHPRPAFGKIPAPQSVVRMPPINWAKYHIVGEPLDKLHEEQRRRPSSGEPQRDDVSSLQRAPEHFIAAPYRPFTDNLEAPMKTRSTNRAKK